MPSGSASLPDAFPQRLRVKRGTNNKSVTYREILASLLIRVKRGTKITPCGGTPLGAGNEKTARLKGATAPRKRNVAKVAPYRRGRCAEHSPSARFASRMGLPLFRPAGAWGRRHSCLRSCGVRFSEGSFSPRGVLIFPSPDGAKLFSVGQASDASAARRSRHEFSDRFSVGQASDASAALRTLFSSTQRTRRKPQS